ncbi:MAG: hypothetical protein KGS72_23600 [Cyanobacteria bacterium REEB67]|nr:hypothetical protein [Cyanobacteria bacterium REEB67]
MDSAVANYSLPKPAWKVFPFDGAAALEFICVGGGSLLIMAFCSTLSNVNFVMRDDVRFFLAQCITFSLLFSVLFAYPHTIWSYRFAYQQGAGFILKHSLELIGYPLAILGLLWLSALTWNIPLSSSPLLGQFERFSAMGGIDLHWSYYQGIGALLLASLLVFQLVVSGYHYGMQAFGVAIACGEKAGYRLSLTQKRCLRVNLYALWMLNLLSGYTFLSLLDYKGFGYQPLHFPWQWKYLALGVFAVTIALVLSKIIWPIFKAQKQLPPLSAIVSIFSVWLWLQPFVQPSGFQAGVVPLAHGVQYLYFSARAEMAGFDQGLAAIASDGRRLIALIFLFMAFVGIGYLAFTYMPVQLDATSLVKHLRPNFFFLAAYIFLNTHHYMIDSVVWRGDSRLRQLV